MADKGKKEGSWISRFLWLLVLAPVLAISGYSLFYVARHLGVPPLFAVGMSTCFDGVALLAARYSLKYAENGMAGSVPRLVVFTEALLGAYIQTFHARLAGQPPGAWVLWASLPVSAVVIYEVHLRWDRRRALAAAGVTYPATLPAFGMASWFFFPGKTYTAMRDVVERRKNAVLAMAQSRTAIVDPNVDGKVKNEGRKDAPHSVEFPTIPVVNKPPTATVPAVTRGATKPNRHAPQQEVRAWAKARGYRIGEKGAIAKSILEDYQREHQQPGEAAA